MADLGSLLGPRSVEDILAERVRLVIGGQVYDLPVLSIKDNRAWRERMDEALGYLVVRLTAEDDTDKILEVFDGSEYVWLELLTSYDVTGVLPDPDDIERGLTPLGLVRAVLEVWRAARPLADISRAGMELDLSTAPTASWRERMRSWLRPTAGQPDTSRRN